MIQCSGERGDVIEYSIAISANRKVRTAARDEIRNATITELLQSKRSQYRFLEVTAIKPAFDDQTLPIGLTVGVSRLSRLEEKTREAMK